MRDTQLGWKKYRSYLEFLGTDDTKKKAMVSERMSRGWCLGTKEFLREMKDEAINRGVRLDMERFEGLEPGEIKDARELHWEDLLSKAAELLGIDLKQLPAAKMAPEKSCLAAVMKQASTAPNRWIADKLEIGNPATASQCAHRWQQNKDQKLKVERIAKRICAKSL